jgi:hypothetical protein
MVIMEQFLLDIAQYSKFYSEFEVVTAEDIAEYVLPGSMEFLQPIDVVGAGNREENLSERELKKLLLGQLRSRLMNAVATLDVDSLVLWVFLTNAVK